MHIIKWKSQPEKQSKSWSTTIEYSRTEIERLKKKFPSLNDDFINENWDKEFEKAKKKAEGEMKKKSDEKGLTWQEVFMNKYTLIIVFLVVVGCFLYY